MTGRARRIIGPTVATLVMIPILLALGFWQVRRLAWKEAILAAIAAGETAPAVPLGAATPSEFTKVSVTGRFDYADTVRYADDVRDRPGGPAMGSFRITPLLRDGAPPVLVDRGWVPDADAAAIARPSGTVTVDGYVRAPYRTSWLSAADDPATRHFYTLDPAAIARALGIGPVAPFTLIALGPADGTWPEPAQHLPRPPNNHLQYALTWFGFALVLVIIYATWLWQNWTLPDGGRRPAAGPGIARTP